MKSMLIINAKKRFQPAVVGDVTWSSFWVGEPSRLEFTMYDTGEECPEGSIVEFSYDGENVFKGFVFERVRDGQNMVHVTCYDQTRYLKQKDTYIYTNKSATDIVRMVSDDYSLNIGNLANTGFTIAQRFEDDSCLWDVILNAIDITLDNTGEYYVFFDEFGSLSLRHIKTMVLDVVITNECLSDFEYTTSIDKDTANTVKVYFDNDATAKRELYVAKDSSTQKQWGILSLTVKGQEGANFQNMADTILKLKNRVTEDLSLKRVFTMPTQLRAGHSIVLDLSAGTTNIRRQMMCARVTHSYSEHEHTCDIDMFDSGVFDA